MQHKKIAKAFFRVLAACVMVFALVLGNLAVGYAEDAVKPAEEDIKLLENCTADFDANKLVVTDTDDNNDVWSSKLLLDAGLELTPGEQYKLSFSLAGENGVGEFFLCKSENIDDRYDETFTSEEGNRSISFTAAGSRVYIGMQVGNLGNGKCVTAEIFDLCKLSESECPALLRTENCTVSVEDGAITATDTGDNNDVWNSKLLYVFDTELEKGKTYELQLQLDGENGVGEFFICKSQNLNERYDATFVNAPGARSVTFKAESDKLYIGMQFGNLGNGNSVTARFLGVKETAPVSGPGNDAAGGDPNAVNCSYTVDGNVITVTDLGSNNDVWDSRLLYDAGIELEVGKKYEIHFTISGDNGVGEFFLCKSQDINDRYDETFTNAAGEKTVIFTAEGTRAYIGMQVGNLGSGNSVTATITEVKEYDESAQTDPRILIAENCSYELDTGSDQTVIKAVDTEDNNDVWNSKILYFLGEILEKGRYYAANFNLAGENGVGEFFFCKRDNLDDRYSFDNVAGDHTARFAAEDSKLYAGMQFGNIGNGNELTVTIYDVYRLLGMQTSSENCSESSGQDTVTLTDTDENNDIWSSKAIYDTGIVLEPGKTYTVTFTLSGDNGVGEFFFLKSDNIDDRYTFDNESGSHTVTFTAENAALYFGVQCGNIGYGNSMTVSNITVTPVESEENSQDTSPATEPLASEETECSDETAITEGAALEEIAG